MNLDLAKLGLLKISVTFFNILLQFIFSVNLRHTPIRTHCVVTKDIRHSVCKHVTVIFSFAKFPKDSFVVACASNDAFYRKNTESRWIFLWLDWTEVSDHWMSVSDDDAGMGPGPKL